MGNPAVHAVDETRRIPLHVEGDLICSDGYATHAADESSGGEQQRKQGYENELAPTEPAEKMMESSDHATPPERTAATGTSATVCNLLVRKRDGLTGWHPCQTGASMAQASAEGLTRHGCTRSVSSIQRATPPVANHSAPMSRVEYA